MKTLLFFCTTYGLAQGPALPNGDGVALLNTEGRTDVRSQVGVSLLISGVFRNEVEVFSADDQGSVHLRRDDGSGEDTAPNRHHTSEWAFLIWK
jgi:hypothetical protein